MRILVAVFASAFIALTAQAADWQPVAASGAERVEIDKARIMRSAPGKTVAWSRLLLGREQADPAGNYSAVQAMNRYDCENRTFVTLRRVYMAGVNHDRAVREERVASPKEMAVDSGIDEKLLAEACKLRTVGEAHKVAEAAAQLAAQAQSGKPGVMYADMRTAGETAKPQTMQVADAGKAEPPAKPPLAERPRFIDLPKIDKSQLESPVAPPKSPDTAKAAENKSAPPTRETAKGVERPAAAPPVAALNRQELERLYATSGPRRAAPAARKKPAEVAVAVPHHDIHWSYDGEGSPANWSKLKPEFATCATGRRQSPIDIRDGIRVDLEPIQFDYQHSYFRIVDNGHTVQVDIGEGSTLKVMNRTFRLTQFHFHRPSEERVNGKVFDMVAHLVHQDEQGRLAVLAVLLEKGPENPLIQTLWNHLPLEVSHDVTPAVAIDLNGLLPENRAYYTYMGSLTTPPCTEDVLWMVFKQPLAVSAEQVAIFSRLYKNNARPIQPANNRLVKENR